MELNICTRRSALKMWILTSSPKECDDWRKPSIAILRAVWAAQTASIVTPHGPWWPWKTKIPLEIERSTSDAPTKMVFPNYLASSILVMVVHIAVVLFGMLRMWLWPGAKIHWETAGCVPKANVSQLMEGSVAFQWWSPERSRRKRGATCTSWAFCSTLAPFSMCYCSPLWATFFGARSWKE